MISIAAGDEEWFFLRVNMLDVEVVCEGISCILPSHVEIDNNSNTSVELSYSERSRYIFNIKYKSK